MLLGGTADQVLFRGSAREILEADSIPALVLSL
jgi:hypothetical protein